MAELLTKNVSPPVRPAEVRIPEPVVDDDVWWDVNPGGMRFTFQDLYDLINANSFDVSELSGVNGKLGNIGDVDVSAASTGFILVLGNDNVWRASDFSEARLRIQDGGSSIQPVTFDANIRDSDDLSVFSAIENTTLTLVSSPVFTGNSSVQMRSGAAGDMRVRTTVASAVTVVAGGVYTVSARLRAQSATRACRVGFEWRDSNDDIISTVLSAEITNSNATWTLYAIEDTVAPSGAVKGTWYYEVLDVSSANEDHFINNTHIERVLVAREALNFINFAVVDDPANNRIDVELDTAALDQAVADVNTAIGELETEVEDTSIALNARVDAVEADMKREAFKAAIIFGGR